MTRKKRKSSTSFKVFCTLLILLLFLIFGIAAYKVYDYFSAGKQAADMTENLIDKAVTVTDGTQYDTLPSTPDGSADTLSADTDSESAIPPPISVDFDVLKQENSDIIAWIHLPNTVINYPIVQSDDNSYYLHRLVNHRYNIAGTLFADCRNDPAFGDENTLIYGHNMTNNTMFGILMDYADQSFYDEHPFFYLMTPEVAYKVKIVAGFVTMSDSDVYTIPLSPEEKETLVAEWLKKSDFIPEYTYTAGDRLITLSTCAEDYGDTRYVIMGVLEKI